MALNGIDIASYQSGLNAGTISADFVIVKATEGTTYTNPSYATHVKQVEAAGKKLGVYHFLRNDSNVKAQADYFLATVKPYIGKAILFLDFENTNGSTIQNQTGVGLAKEWLDYVYAKTGARPIIYMGLASENALDWNAVVKGNYGLWVAQYNNYNVVNGYNPRDMYGSVKHWPSTAIFQYTSAGRLSGYNGNLDFDVFYGDKAAWDKYAKAGNVTVNTTTKAPAKPAAYSTNGKNLATMASDVLAGRAGAGNARINNLGKFYTSVQAVVNYQLKAMSATELNKVLASEIKKGVFGTDPARKNLLGSYYAGAQAVINQSVAPVMKVGSNVVVTRAVDWNGNGLGVSGVYKVMQMDGNRVVIGRGGVVTAAIAKSNLRLA